MPLVTASVTLPVATSKAASAHHVITIDTASLVEAHHDRIVLSGINSGATLYPNAAPRGSDTFRSIADYDYAKARRRRGAKDAIVELAVVDGVPDLAQHFIRVERRKAAVGRDLLFERAE